LAYAPPPPPEPPAPAVAYCAEPPAPPPPQHSTMMLVTPAGGVNVPELVNFTLTACRLAGSSRARPMTASARAAVREEWSWNDLFVFINL